MPKSNKGGVSNRLVDPDFIAEPGVPVERAVDEGLPNVNGVEESGESPDEQERDEQTDQPEAPAKAGAKDRQVAPANQTPAFEPKKSPPNKKR